jgi:hypothetical protein
MRAMTIALAAFAVGASSSQLSPLIRPNFSGKWTLVGLPAGSHPPSIGSATLGYAFEVNQDEKALTLVTGNDPIEFRSVYPLDGSATRVTHAASVGFSAPLQFEVQAHWENGRLFLRSTMVGPAGLPASAYVVTQTWSYDMSGQLLIETSGSGGPLPPRTSTSKYRKTR